MEERINKVKRLINKYNATKGMVCEVAMKCSLLKSKVQAARRSGEENPELAELVNNSLIQYRSDLSKYRKRMNRIYRRVEELCH